MPNKPTTAGPRVTRRRWFQFRLRTLLIVVVGLTIPCAYVAHEAEIVRRRAAERRALEKNGAKLFPHEVGSFAGHAENGPSWLRRLLGDEWIDAIAVKLSDADRAIRAFPEAVIEPPEIIFVD